MTANIRRLENLHILLWLLKDTCWVLGLRIEGVIMIIPTIAMALYITWRTRKSYSELFHNLAVCSWIIANSIWMIGEFFFNDGTRRYACIFFFLGLLFVIIYYMFFAKRERQTSSKTG